MKLADIVKVLAQELGTSDIKEINKLLKADKAGKFRITGEEFGHFGFTGKIKSISEEGVKIFLANKVSLVRLDEIETFGKPNSREERIARKGTPKPAPKPKPGKVPKAELEDDNVDEDDFEDFNDEDDESDEDFDDEIEIFEEEEAPAKKPKKAKAAPSGKSGSKFIPRK